MNYLLFILPDHYMVHLGNEFNIVRFSGPESYKVIGTGTVAKISGNKIGMRYVLVDDLDTLTLDDKVEVKR